MNQTTNKYAVRISIIVVGITASVALGITAWWFWTAIMQDPARQKLDIIGYVTLLGLGVSAIGGCVASLLFARKNEAFVKYANASGLLAIASIISVMITSVFTYLPSSNAAQSLGEAWRSFIGFGRLDFGIFSISLTGTLALIGGVALVVAIIGRQKK